MPPRVSFYKKWRTKNISVAFGSFFTYQGKEATESLLLLLGDYLLQPSKAKRAADWNHAGASGSINRYTVSFCALASKKDGPTECLTLYGSKNPTSVTEDDSRA